MATKRRDTDATPTRRETVISRQDSIPNRQIWEPKAEAVARSCEIERTLERAAARGEIEALRICAGLARGVYWRRAEVSARDAAARKQRELRAASKGAA